jgi:hypothetical protein
MPRALLLALALASSSAATGAPAASSLETGSAGWQSPPTQGSIALELRIFLGSEEVTRETRVTVHKAGDRGTPVVQTTAPTGSLELMVPPGIYDVQAIREHDGKVTNIRWAERLVVMPYPDEGGHHLEVVNFTSGFGALEVRAPKLAAIPEVLLFKAGQHDRPTTGAAAPNGAYALFVVPAGPYDVEIRGGAKPSRYSGIEVPLDRTRLWLVP